MLVSQQLIENFILGGYGLAALYLLHRLVRHVHAISIAVRLAQPEAAPKMPVTNKELAAFLGPTEEGRYARITFPDSLRPFKETSLDNYP